MSCSRWRSSNRFYVCSRRPTSSLNAGPCPRNSRLLSLCHSRAAPCQTALPTHRLPAAQRQRIASVPSAGYSTDSHTRRAVGELVRDCRDCVTGNRRRPQPARASTQRHYDGTTTHSLTPSRSRSIAFTCGHGQRSGNIRTGTNYAAGGTMRAVQRFGRTAPQLRIRMTPVDNRRQL